MFTIYDHRNSKRIFCNSSRVKNLIFFSDFTREFLSSNPTLKKTCLNQLIDYGLQLKQSKDEIAHFIVKISTGLEKNDIDRVLTKCLDIDKEIYVKLVCELKIENKFTEIIQVIFISQVNV